MNELIVKVLAIPLIPVVTVLLLKAIHRNPDIVGLKQNGAIAGNQSAIPPRQELEKRLVKCSPSSSRTVSLLSDKDLNDAVFKCEKS